MYGHAVVDLLKEALHDRVPDMAKVDTGACCGSRTVNHAIPFHLRRYAYRVAVELESSHHRRVAAIAHLITYIPLHIGLPDIGYRLIFERMILVEEEAALPVGKLIIFGSRHREGGAALLDITFAAACPCTLGRGKHAGIKIVLVDDIILRGHLGVVPR